VHEIGLPTGKSADGFDGTSFWMQRASIPAYIKGDADSLLGAVDESFEVALDGGFRNVGQHPLNMPALKLRTNMHSTCCG
jgi:hypothetical protein